MCASPVCRHREHSRVSLAPAYICCVRARVSLRAQMESRRCTRRRTARDTNTHAHTHRHSMERRSLNGIRDSYERVSIWLVGDVASIVVVALCRIYVRKVSLHVASPFSVRFCMSTVWHMHGFRIGCISDDVHACVGSREYVVSRRHPQCDLSHRASTPTHTFRPTTFANSNIDEL